MVGVAALGVLAGYGLVISNPTTMKSEGFRPLFVEFRFPAGAAQGFFGSPRTSPETRRTVSTKAKPTLAWARCCCWWSRPPRAESRSRQRVRRHWALCALLAVFAVYAASNLVYAGSVLLISYNLPAAALSLGNYFRATGRFIWPLAYSLTLLPLALLFRSWPRHPRSSLHSQRRGCSSLRRGRESNIGAS